MKNRWFIGLAFVMLLAAFATGALAAGSYKLIVDGKKIDADIRDINGTVYVPLRTVSEALGAAVRYDKTSQTITLHSSPRAAPAAQDAADESRKGSRQHPASLGETVVFAAGNGADATATGSITIEEIVRGKEAWEQIYATNRFNKAPRQGYEYILAKVTVSIDSHANPDAAVDVNAFDFTLVSSAGADYPAVAVVTPDPPLRTKIYVGGTYTGWAAFQVRHDDAEPLIANGRKHDGTSGLWFKTAP
ncbi:stalk domain-containing protein [Paenibacillus thiaminolyticus]|uniref:stalk domain-containing protein n=1 Tax=Paenibacillus thiaminolyticus TaxID=49283 RepID=UPI003D29CD3F